MTHLPIVLTGAARDGIGEGILRRLTAQGVAVYGSYSKDQRDKAVKLAGEIPSATLMEVDHADRKSLARFVAGAPAKVAGAVFAEMFFAMENPHQFDHDLWDRSLAVNLTAPNYLTHELRSRFCDGASVVTITSTEGFIGSFGASAYAATKAAMHNLTKSLANTFGPSVRVNAVAPGWIGGVMDTDEIFEMSRTITPARRLGDATEVAALVWFLLSGDAPFINGATLTIDGGYTGVDTISKLEFEASQTSHAP